MVCNRPATVLISLRAYFGSPALIDSPELNDDCPIRTCAGLPKYARNEIKTVAGLLQTN